MTKHVEERLAANRNTRRTRDERMRDLPTKRTFQRLASYYRAVGDPEMARLLELDMERFYRLFGQDE